MVSLNRIDLNLLRVLHHVLQEGSVVRAAERLAVTPSAVSNSLAQLRLIFRDPLLVRNGRTLVPTPKAQELRPQLAAALEQLRPILGPGDTFDPGAIARTFTIATADNVVLLQAVSARFARELPNAKLRIVTLDYATMADALARGEVDVLLGVPWQMQRDWRSEAAFTERLVCAMSAANPLAGQPLKLSDYMAASHIEVAIRGNIPIDYVDTVLAGLGKRRTIALSVPQFMLAAVCAVGSSHIATIPESLAEWLKARLPLFTCDPPFPVPRVTFLQVWHVRTDLDPASKLLRRIIREPDSATAES